MPFVTSLGVGAHLEAWGVPAQRITELDWWQSHTLPNADLTVTAAPSQRVSGRGLKDRNATLWSSMVIRSKRHSAFFSGDTGLTTEYATLRERLGPFDLVQLEVGAFHPSWGDPTALSGLNNRHQYVDFKYCFASRQTNFDFDL